MGKNVQIVLLVCVFAVCGTGGYFLGGLVPDDVEPQPVVETAAPVVAPEPAPSAVPVVSEVSMARRNESTGKYSIDVTASVPSGDNLIYVLYSDETCSVEVAKELTGQFVDIPASASARYWLRVENLKTGDKSEVCPVDGFRQITMYKKITKEEVERICNTNDFSTAGSKAFHSRISNQLKLMPIGMKSGERPVASVSDICNKISMNTWDSITVEDNIAYDGQNRMIKLTFKVNYPTE